VNENDCGGGGCLELSIYVNVWTEDGGGRKRTEDGGRKVHSHKEIQESLNKDIRACQE
jgi:hypothetical protein